jgi:serine/threonine protein kinase
VTPARAIGRYEIVRQIAEGRDADVFIATVPGELGNRREVAIKRFRGSASEEPFRTNFLDELQLFVAGDDHDRCPFVHAHLVRIFEIGTDFDAVFAAMELVDGIDLRTVARRCAQMQQTIPAELAALIVREVLDALDHVHRAVGSDGKPLHTVHRHVSLSNVLVSWRGDVKLAGLGIAHVLASRSRMAAGPCIGASDCLSPEQVSALPVDARSDVFSVGTVLAELCIGRLLFRGADDLQTLLRIRDARLDRLAPSTIPPKLLPLITRALARRSEERWRSAAEFRDAIDAAMPRVGPEELARWLERCREPLP